MSLTKEDLKSISDILEPRFEAVDRRISNLVDFVAEMNQSMKELALTVISTRADIRRIDHNISHLYEIHERSERRISGIEKHLDVKYYEEEDKVMDKPNIKYQKE